MAEGEPVPSTDFHARYNECDQVLDRHAMVPSTQCTEDRQLHDNARDVSLLRYLSDKQRAAQMRYYHMT